MSALLLVEVIDTAGVLLDAVMVWIAAIAFVVTVCLYTAILTSAWAWRAVRRRQAPASVAHSAPCDSRVAEMPASPARARTAPRWAHDEQEAA